MYTRIFISFYICIYMRKDINVYTKMHTEQWKQSSTFKQRLKISLLAIKMFTVFTTDVMLHTFVFVFVYIYNIIYIYK